jgi:hypothetical protein
LFLLLASGEFTAKRMQKIEVTLNQLIEGLNILCQIWLKSAKLH